MPSAPNYHLRLEFSICGSVRGVAKLKAETTVWYSACKLRFDIREEPPLAGSNMALHLWVRVSPIVIRSGP